MKRDVGGREVKPAKGRKGAKIRMPSRGQMDRTGRKAIHGHPNRTNRARATSDRPSVEGGAFKRSDGEGSNDQEEKETAGATTSYVANAYNRKEHKWKAMQMESATHNSLSLSSLGYRL